MKKNILIRAFVCVILIGGIIMLGSGCTGKKYSVDYGGQKSLFKNAKDSYFAGTDVKIYYNMIATDTTYCFYLDGKEIQPEYNEKTGFCIRFEMPEHNVKLAVASKNISVAENFGFYKEEEVLTFHSFDGGGPEFTVDIEDPSVASYQSVRRYNKPDHDMLTGAGYDVFLIFKGLKAGSTRMTVSSFSPIAGSEEYSYIITVNEKLMITVKEQTENS